MPKTNEMPQIKEGGCQYIKAATDAIKSAGSMRDLYVAIYGVQPTRYQYQTFINRLNPSRANPSTDILGACVENLPSLHDVTLKEFFGIGSTKK